jgi:hypothetical protein
MPTTLTGVLLFVVLLLPGFAYQVGKERRGTERTTSVLRETAAVVAASVASEIFVLAATSWLWSRHIDFGRLVREPRKYWLFHPATIVWWGAGLLAGAIVVAYLVTLLRGWEIPRWGHRVAKGLKWIRVGKRRPVFAVVCWVWRQVTYTHPSAMSAWGMLFQGAKRSEVLVDIRLTDGAWVSGALMSISSVGADTPDRDLVLGPPVRFRGARGKNLHDYPVGNVVISARQISAMFVTKLPSGQSIDAPGRQLLVVLRRRLRRKRHLRNNELAVLTVLETAAAIREDLLALLLCPAQGTERRERLLPELRVVVTVLDHRDPVVHPDLLKQPLGRTLNRSHVLTTVAVAPDNLRWRLSSARRVENRSFSGHPLRVTGSA